VRCGRDAELPADRDAVRRRGRVGPFPSWRRDPVTVVRIGSRSPRRHRPMPRGRACARSGADKAE
jgi:hypothetical protein